MGEALQIRVSAVTWNEDLVEKFRYDTKTCSRLKKHIEDFDNLNSDTSDNASGLAYYLEKVGVNPRTSFSPNDVEKLRVLLFYSRKKICFS